MSPQIHSSDRFQFLLLPLFVTVTLLTLVVSSSLRAQGDGGRQARPITVVNGTPITAEEYQSRVARYLEAELMARGFEMDEGVARIEIWNRMVDEILIRQGADSLGITISDVEIERILRDDPPEGMMAPFTDSSGVFQAELYRQFISDPRKFLLERGISPDEVRKIEENLASIRKDMRNDYLERHVRRAVTSRVNLSAAEAFELWSRQNTTGSGMVAILDPGSIPDEQIEVTEGEARRWYDAHRNDYGGPDTREIEYLFLPFAPSADDSSRAFEELEAAKRELLAARTREAKDALHADWNERQGVVYHEETYDEEMGPDAGFVPFTDLSGDLRELLSAARPGAVIGPVWLSDDAVHLIDVVAVDDRGQPYVRAAHILLKIPSGKEDSVRKVAENLLRRVKGGESFEQLAVDYSEDPGSGPRGGELGYFGKGMMVEPFEKASFAAKPGTIVGPVRSDFGYHLIKVIDRDTRRVRMNDWKLSPVVSDRTKGDLMLRAGRLRDELVNGAGLQALADREGLYVLESGPTERLVPVGTSMRLTSFAWQGKLGDISEPMEIPSGGVAVAVITKANRAGIRDYADVRAFVMEQLRWEKKLDMMKERAEKLRAGVASVRDLERLASNGSVYLQRFEDHPLSGNFPAVGDDSVLVRALFTREPGRISPAIRGARAGYILLVESRRSPTEEDFAGERETFIEETTRERGLRAYLAWLDEQRRRATIIDRREGVY